MKPLGNLARINYTGNIKVLYFYILSIILCIWKLSNYRVWSSYFIIPSANISFQLFVKEAAAFTPGWIFRIISSWDGWKFPAKLIPPFPIRQMSKTPWNSIMGLRENKTCLIRIIFAFLKSVSIFFYFRETTLSRRVLKLVFVLKTLWALNLNMLLKGKGSHFFSHFGVLWGWKEKFFINKEIESVGCVSGKGGTELGAVKWNKRPFGNKPLFFSPQSRTIWGIFHFSAVIDTYKVCALLINNHSFSRGWETPHWPK